MACRGFACGTLANSLRRRGRRYFDAAGIQPDDLNELADDQSNDDDNSDFQLITIRINGGTTGLDGRRAYWAQAKKVLGVA